MKTGFVYITTNKRRNVLYIEITSDLEGRVLEHKLGVQVGFTKKYKISVMHYFETLPLVTQAISRKKQLKR
ncbi:MAG: GIY-YIG nuclease family protein [Bacteroidetes bacterium]|nr:GIY-YIG nuclease family protein [Bacteroidota bacterium]